MSLAEMADRLIPEELRAGLSSDVIGREIIVLKQTGSTNDAILQVANVNSKEGLVVFAEYQTAGRGQRGNRWEKAAHLAIAGIGINVNQSRENFPVELQSTAISLAMALGKQVDRQSFAIALLRNLDRTYRARFASS